MSKKTQTTTTNQYNPASMGTYNAFQPQIQSNLSDYAKNPLESTFFNQRYAKDLGQTQLLGQRGMSNIFMNAKAGGYGSNMPGFMAAMMGSQARANSGMEANSFTNNLLSAEDARRWATSSMQGYQPLQTGQNTVQKESGLGTWLPQVIGAGAAIGLGAMTGGASMGMTGAMSGAMGGALGGGLSAAGGMMGGSNASRGSFGGFNPFGGQQGSYGMPQGNNGQPAFNPYGGKGYTQPSVLGPGLKGA